LAISNVGREDRPKRNRTSRASLSGRMGGDGCVNRDETCSTEEPIKEVRTQRSKPG